MSEIVQSSVDRTSDSCVEYSKPIGVNAMKLCDVLAELSKFKVPDKVVLRIVEAFRAEGMLTKRREYSRDWQKNNRRKPHDSAPEVARTSQSRANGTA